MKKKIKHYFKYHFDKEQAKKIGELTIFSFLLALLIAPGLFYTDIMAHEFYHYASHKNISEEICLDLNKPYSAHVKIIFDDAEELLKYEAEELDAEERRANIVGHTAAFFYLINAMVVVNWMLLLIIRSIDITLKGLVLRYIEKERASLYKKMLGEG